MRATASEVRLVAMSRVSAATLPQAGSLSLSLSFSLSFSTHKYKCKYHSLFYLVILYSVSSRIKT